MSREQEERHQRERRGRVDYEELAKKAKQGGGTTVRLPENCEWLKLEEGEIEFDFMPFLATEDKANKNPNADAGYEICYRDYVVHKDVPMLDGRTRSICCLAVNWKEPCALCREEMKWTGDPGDNPLRKQTRRLYLLNDRPGDLNHLPGSEKNPWKVVDQAYKNRGRGFGEMYDYEMKRYRDHDLLDGGYTARVRVQANTFKGRQWMEIVKLDFSKRDYAYPDSLIYKAPCLDETLIKPSPDDLEQMLSGGIPPEEEPDRPAKKKDDEDDRPAARDGDRGRGRDEDEDRPPRRREEPGEDDRPARTSSRAAREDDEEDRSKRNGSKDPTAKELGLKTGDIVVYKFKGKDVECDIMKISGDGTSLLLEGPDGQEYKAVAPGEVKKWKGREEEPDRPAKKKDDEDDRPARGKGEDKSRKPAVDEDDDVLPDEDEDRPAKKPVTSKARDEDAPLRDEDDDERPRGGKKPAAKRRDDDD